MKKYLLNEADRREIAALLSRQYSAPPPNPIKESQKVVHEEGDSYWALPTCEVGYPRVKFVDDASGGVRTQSSLPAYCCLYRVGKTKTAQEFSLVEPVLDINGSPVRVLVHNLYTWAENGLRQIWQKKDGTWTVERSDSGRVTADSTTRSPGQNPGDKHTTLYGCEGDCFWQADQNGVWQMPTGGCQNATTSTSTTTTSAPTTSYDPNNPGDEGLQPPVTVSPCINTKCTLVCIDTSTTPAPNEYGVPTPYQRFRYALKDGSVCPTGCTCYGLGDPCFLVEGELVSNCIGTGPTTTPAPTTPSPSASPCSHANFIFGTASPDTYRSAITRQGAEFGEWQNCKQCPAGKYPLFRDFFHLREHNWDKLASVFESPCVASPCDEARGQQMQALIDTGEARAIFRAYPYDRQLDLWKIDGVNKLSRDGTIRFDRDTDTFVGNWFQCVTCPAGYRPRTAPPVWVRKNELTIDPIANFSLDPSFIPDDVTFHSETNTYVYYTQCVLDEAYPCEACKRGRIFPPTVIDPPLPAGTTSTTSTTTKNPHCGCSRPSFCPKPFECTRTVCSKEGAAVFPSGVSQTTVPPSDGLPCFPSNTTTSTSTSAPSTTNAPNQCIGTDGRLCICPTQSTAPPSGGTCPPGYRLVYGETGGGCRTIACIFDPFTPGDPPFSACLGGCYWEGRYVFDETGNATWTGWRYTGSYAVDVAGNDIRSRSQSCSPPSLNATCADAGGCCCDRPPDPTDPPADINGQCLRDFITTCNRNDPPVTTSTTPNPCGCCSSTPDPCFTGYCRYSSTVSNTWTLRDNKCPTRCACPPAASVSLPVSGSCNTITVACGYIFPPPPPTSTTTTNPPPSACCLLFTSGASQCLVIEQVFCSQYRTQPNVASAVFSAGLNCTQVTCGQPTTTTSVPRGACCVASRQGTAAPTWQCLNDTERTPCNQIGGLFFVNQNCSSDPCGLASTTTTTTVNPTLGACCYTLACYDNQLQSVCVGSGGNWASGLTCSQVTGGTCATTTNDPSLSCCWRNGPFPLCASGYGSANCIAAGGVVISNCGACTVSTTTTTLGPGTTTTTAGPGTSTTPNPCLSCYIRQCGCSTGTEVTCSEGTVLDCVACGCVPTTTPAPTTTTTTTTTTGAPPPL
jgi:hypothetical protein